MDIVTEFSKMENGVSLYLQDGTCVPEKDGPDQYMADQFLMEYGIVNPHISSSTGVNVFDFYTQVKLADGSINYLVKEYNVAAIASEFSLSFYNNAGFSYIINTGGDVLIRSPHPGSNKTVKNILICFLRERTTAGQWKNSVRLWFPVKAAGRFLPMGMLMRFSAMFQ